MSFASFMLCLLCLLDNHSIHTWPTSVCFGQWKFAFYGRLKWEWFIFRKGEQSVASESYDETEFEDLHLFALDKNADKSDNEEGPYSQEPLANDQWLQEYQQERWIIEAREWEFQNRMDRVMELDSS